MGIALENVSFTYQEGTPLASTALSDVSLTIEDGSYTALIGHTGSGKSTILQLLNGLLVRYIESMVYQGVIENIACEQSARMVAMKAATDNAGELIKSLQLIYNKLRQAAITQEISEIVGGAAAV